MILTAVVLLLGQTDGLIPWKEISTGGAALLIAALLVWVVRVLSQQHRDCNETTTKITDKFASTVEKQQEAFSATTTKLVEDARASHERREERLHDLLRELRGAPRG